MCTYIYNLYTLNARANYILASTFESIIDVNIVGTQYIILLHDILGQYLLNEIITIIGLLNMFILIRKT